MVHDKIHLTVLTDSGFPPALLVQLQKPEGNCVSLLVDLGS